MTEDQIKRFVFARLTLMAIDDTRELPNELGGGIVERQSQSRLEWILPLERYGFGGSGKSWDTARNQLVEAIWNRLHGLPVTNAQMRHCKQCGRAFASAYRTLFCDKRCSEKWHYGRLKEAAS